MHAGGNYSVARLSSRLSTKVEMSKELESHRRKALAHYTTAKKRRRALRAIPAQFFDAVFCTALSVGMAAGKERSKNASCQL